MAVKKQKSSAGISSTSSQTSVSTLRQGGFGDPSVLYDIICIGAGSGGLNIAGFMNRVGLRVLLIDKSDRSIGGDCLNHGCVPSKALIHSARHAKIARDAQRFGFRVSGTVDLESIQKTVFSKQEFIREHENASYFRGLGMDVELGHARFVGPRKVRVGKKIFSAKKILIATGSRPRTLSLKGIEAVSYHSNETIFSLKKLPKKLLVIGGGPIGVELGQAFSHLGSNVTIINRGAQFLPKEDPQIAKRLHTQLELDGVTLYLDTETLEFPTAKSIKIKENGKAAKTISFDEVLISIGRVLNIDQLDVEMAGIEFEDDSKQRLKVNKYLQTTNKNVLVCGDVAGSYQFTHVAELHASVLIHNFFSPLKKKVSYDHLSWVTYTTPEIATFGLSQKELIARKLPFETLEHSFEHDDRAICDEGQTGFLRIYTNGKKILGGTMIANNAGELFQELVLINSNGFSPNTLFKKIYPYPTASRVNKAIMSSYLAKKLTKRVQKIFRLLYH